MYYIGWDVHQRTIRYCVKDGGRKIHGEGVIPATRFDFGSLDEDASATVDGRDGSDHFHRLDPRFLTHRAGDCRGRRAVMRQAGFPFGAEKYGKTMPLSPSVSIP
jgi:hypothetical protein